MVTGAINTIMMGKNYAVLTERNAKVQGTADHVQQWAASNPAAFEGGCQLLLALLIPCLDKPETSRRKSGEFHQI